jgi:anti-sigma factor (TIGR02949 family)
MSEPVATSGTGPAPIDCEQAVRRLWDFVDGRLPSMKREEVEEHLATCAACLRRFDFAQTMRATLAASAPPPVDTDEAARLRERVRAVLMKTWREER